MEKINQNNAIIKRADKGQLNCYIKNKHSEKIIIRSNEFSTLNKNSTT
jgi:citrate lyase gamma subunit